MFKTKLFKNTTIYALGDIIPKIASLLIFPVLTTYLSPSEYGKINYIFIIDTFLSIFGVLGLNTYFLVYYFKQNSEYEQKKLMGSISMFILIFTIFISLILHLIGPYFFKIWGSNIDFYPYVSLGIIISITNIVTYIPTCLFRVQEKPLPLTIINITKSIFIMIISVLVVIYYNGQALEVIQARLIVSLLFALIFIIFTKKYSSYSIDWSIIKNGLKFSLPLVPGSLAFYLFSLSDRLLIDKYLSLNDLGIYSTAMTLTLILNIVSNGAYKAFEPYFFQHYESKNFTHIFTKVRDMLLFIVLLFGMCISIFAKEFFYLFSSEAYHNAYKIVPILVLGVIASSMRLLYGTIIIAKGNTKIETYITIIGCLVSVILNVIFLRKFGIMLSSIVFALTFIIVLMLSIIASKIKIRHFRSTTASIIATITSILCSYYININSVYFSIFVKSVILISTMFIIGKILRLSTFSIINIIKR